MDKILFGHIVLNSITLYFLYGNCKLPNGLFVNRLSSHLRLFYLIFRFSTLNFRFIGFFGFAFFASLNSVKNKQSGTCPFYCRPK